MYVNLVQTPSRRRIRHRCLWLFSWRRNLPHRSRKTYSTNRFRMGRSCGCINPDLYPCNLKHRYEITSSTTQGWTVGGAKSISAAFIYAVYYWRVLGFLGSVYPLLLCNLVCRQGQYPRQCRPIRTFPDECTPTDFVN
jgi:hypothetical protein